MEQVFKVLPEHGANQVGSGTLPVLATPILLRFMEQVANDDAQTRLEEGQTSVGVHVELQHLKASPIGAQVTVLAQLKESNDRRLTYSIEAFEDGTLIGKASHKRAIVEIDTFMAKL